MDPSKLTDKIFSQCVNMFNKESNQKKIRTQVVDPLFTYMKKKLGIYFIIIIILLLCIFATNILLIFNIRTLLNTMRQTVTNAV